jgi:hypothetical protein
MFCLFSFAVCFFSVHFVVFLPFLPVFILRFRLSLYYFCFIPSFFTSVHFWSSPCFSFLPFLLVYIFLCPFINLSSSFPFCYSHLILFLSFSSFVSLHIYYVLSLYFHYFSIYLLRFITFFTPVLSCFYILAFFLSLNIHPARMWRIRGVLPPRSPVRVYHHTDDFPSLSGVTLSPLSTAVATDLLYQPQMIDDGDYGATGGMKIGRGNRSTRRKPAPAPLCPPQIPYDSNPNRRGGKPATNRLSYGSAVTWIILPTAVHYC